MRTKTLYLTALLGAVSIATSVAQTVYSVNAVGYVNVTLPPGPGFSLVANPLVAETNTIAALFSAAPKGTVVYKFDSASGQYQSAIKSPISGAWNALGTTLTLVPGEGAFVKNPTTSNVVITFVGEVMQGTLTNTLARGFSIASSQVPQEDNLDNLGFPKARGDVIYQYINNAYKSTTVSPISGNWPASGAPVIAVGEAFFVKKGAQTEWTRSFSVNQ